MRRPIHLALASALALTALVVSVPGPAAACVSLPAPFDSFSAAVPGADTIAIGTVEGLSGHEAHTRFRLHVDEVLRGKAPAAMRFGGLSGSERRSACGDRNTVVVRHGDRLALAMDGAAPGQPLRVDAVAFVGESVPDRQLMRKMERLPARKVRRLAGVAADGSSSKHPVGAGPAADGLFTEQVARGVTRVRALGNAHGLRTIRHLDVGADDRVWAAASDRAFKLSARKEYGVDDGARLTAIETQPDGEALGTADGIWRFSGHVVWYRLGTGKDDGLYAPHTATDGRVWALSDRGPAVISLPDNRWAYSEWQEVGAPDACLGKDGQLACDPTPLVDAPGGSLWLGFAGHTPAGAGGIQRFDGEAWGPAPSPVDGPFAVHDLTSEPGGPVWALVTPRMATGEGAPTLARWDGQSWALSELPTSLADTAASQSSMLITSPDGSVWLSRPLARFDGETWDVYDVPGRSGPGRSWVTDLSIASDGTAWMVVRRKTASGKTRPDGIYVLDPARAVPVAPGSWASS